MWGKEGMKERSGAVVRYSYPKELREPPGLLSPTGEQIAICLHSR